jgi:hypothetical protein
MSHRTLGLGRGWRTYGGCSVTAVVEIDDVSHLDDKAGRRAARERVAAYHQEQLRVLLEHVRAGLAQLDGGEIDEFDLDDLIHRYKRAARSCGRSAGRAAASGSRPLTPSLTRGTGVRNQTGGRGSPPYWGSGVTCLLWEYELSPWTRRAGFGDAPRGQPTHRRLRGGPGRWPSRPAVGCEHSEHRRKVERCISTR